jgi:hypothetical protein
MFRSISDRLKAPFMNLPTDMISIPNELRHSIPDSLRMGVGYRFLPGQVDFLINELAVQQDCIEKLSLISSKLGFSYSSSPLSEQIMSSHSWSGTGLRGLSTPNKILVEVLTYCNGMYGRFLVLVSLGIGCTVWYGFLPGIPVPQGVLY